MFDLLLGDKSGNGLLDVDALGACDLGDGLAGLELCPEFGRGDAERGGDRVRP